MRRIFHSSSAPIQEGRTHRIAAPRRPPLRRLVAATPRRLRIGSGGRGIRRRWRRRGAGTGAIHRSGTGLHPPQARFLAQGGEGGRDGAVSAGGEGEQQYWGCGQPCSALVADGVRDAAVRRRQASAGRKEKGKHQVRRGDFSGREIRSRWPDSL
uniref:Uncharacterized protein n=1 Tax=Arundo donax TaxID=35708 RepID=A0A0A9DN50_ARUDO